MDCRTASLLSEAYHDDELELVDAARLLAHFEGCPACRERCEETGRLRETLKTCRPVDRCPEELARKLARRLEIRARPRRAWPRSATIVLAAGCGIAAGWAAVRYRIPAAGSFGFADPVKRVEGELLCLRCAMARGLPGVRLDGTPHRPLLLTADGRLFVVHAAERALGRLEVDGPARRRVAVMARLHEPSGTADVEDVLADAGPAPSASAAAR